MNHKWHVFSFDIIISVKKHFGFIQLVAEWKVVKNTENGIYKWGFYFKWSSQKVVLMVKILWILSSCDHTHLNYSIGNDGYTRNSNFRPPSANIFHKTIVFLKSYILAQLQMEGYTLAHNEMDSETILHIQMWLYSLFITNSHGIYTLNVLSRFFFYKSILHWSL